MPHAEPKFMYDCFLCRKPFEFANGVYDGRSINPWGIRACRICTSSNWDGLVPDQHPRLIEHLKAKGIPIELNARGWLPIPPIGS